VRPEFGDNRSVSPLGQPYRIVMAARTLPAPSFEIVVGVDGAPDAAALDAAGLADTPEAISRFQSLVARKIRGIDGAVAGEIAAGTTTLDVPRTGFGQNLAPHFESNPPDTATAVALAGFRAMAVPTVQPLNPGQPAGFNTQVNSPLCNDQTASNFGGVAPCIYKPDPPVFCLDPRASNYGGPLPCVIVDPVPTCVVPAPETRPGTCPSGQTGTLTEQRTASCPDPFGTPVWSGWGTLSSSCQAPPSGGGGGTTPATCVAPAAEQRPAVCPPRAGANLTGGIVTEQRTWSCPTPTGSPVDGGWTEVGNTCAYESIATCTPPATETRTIACPARDGFNLRGGVISQQRAWTCPSTTGSPVQGAWVETSSTCDYEPQTTCVPGARRRTQSCPAAAVGQRFVSGAITEEQRWTCPSSTGAPVEQAWQEVENSCTYVSEPVTCTPGTETRDRSCPTGEIGLIREQATRTCPSGPYGAPATGPWVVSENTCRPGCVVPPPLQSTGPCPTGFTGTILYETPYACPTGASSPVLGEPVEVRRDCTGIPFRPKPLAAGCIVDTDVWDTAAFPSCPNLMLRTSTDALLFSVGQVLNNGDEQWVFEDMGRFEVTWTGACASPAKLNESQCALWNVPNGSYTATATVRDVVTNTVRTFTMTAEKNVTRCTPTDCPDVL
jgi:hypothetical protein